MSTSISSTDHCDTDTGPNGGQNFPIISSVRKDLATGQTTIRVRLNSEPDKTYAVRFFSNPGGTDIEGKTYIGKKSVTTKPSNDPTAPCARTFIYITNKAPGKFVTATATDPNGNTSEFSAPVGVVSQ